MLFARSSDLFCQLTPRFFFVSLSISVKEMKKPLHLVFGFVSLERKWFIPLVASSLVSLTLFIAATLSLGVSSDGKISSGFRLFSYKEVAAELRVEPNLLQLPSSGMPDPPRLAYVISGTKGDGTRMKRALQALYHPRNYYLLHLDLQTTSEERVELARYVRLEPAFFEADNVYVVGKGDMVTYSGPTMTACTLHAAAILLRKNKDWDWFINLSASDYPLMTQDDLLHVLSYLPRDLNFIEHTSDLAWKEFQRAKPIIVDPGLSMSMKADIFWITQRRAIPSSFKLFTGSAWVALTRAFIEFCIEGWDNLPRTVLMYYTNFVSSPEGYFHTVICNTREFQNTTVNHDLHYITWNNPPKQHPLSLGLADFDAMTLSGVPFARKFDNNDPVLDRIDKELLGRKEGRLTPGGWCLGSSTRGRDPCYVMGDSSVLKPGTGSIRFEKLVRSLLSEQKFRSNQCVIH